MANLLPEQQPIVREGGFVSRHWLEWFGRLAGAAATMSPGVGAVTVAPGGKYRFDFPWSAARMGQVATVVLQPPTGDLNGYLTATAAVAAAGVVTVWLTNNGGSSETLPAGSIHLRLEPF